MVNSLQAGRKIVQPWRQHMIIFNGNFVKIQTSFKEILLKLLLKPRLHYTRRNATWRDAIWRDSQVLFTLCATLSRAVTWQQGIWDPEQIKWCNLNGCFDPTWHCVYLTDIPPKITSIRITQPHKHITWNTNSSHWWVLIKVCWGVNPGCVNSTSHVTLNQAS